MPAEATKSAEDTEQAKVTKLMAIFRADKG